jgi:hypothetical protein
LQIHPKKTVNFMGLPDIPGNPVRHSDSYQCGRRRRVRL